MPEFDRPLRIGLLTHSVNPRGGVVHTLELARALHDAGHAVTVMAPAAPGQAFFRRPPCRVELVPVHGKPAGTVEMARLRIEAFVRHLGRLLADEDFDVLHTHDSIGGNALAQLRDTGRIEGFVRTVHHLDSFDDARLMRWQRIAFEEAGQVLCVSRLWREHLAREHGIAAEEVQNGVDTARFSPAAGRGDALLAARLGLVPGAPVVLAVGGIEERKNSVRLLSAFALLRATHPQAQLVIAGGASLLDHEGCAQAFRARMQRLGLAEGPLQPVRLTGPLPDEDMPALYRLADVVAMPSLREGFGLVVLEGLASGAPVVASRIAPFVDYLAEDDVSWAEPHDAASIAGALADALARRDPARIARSAERLARRFSWKASAERHLALYRAGLRARAAGRVPAQLA
ncbi:MSMEG_0565 family glycosyltransferase [Variovorax sp. RA8]|uniref:MSMEG_0565 family glycosyltransferase n=1 Tax=Variovorax sp. (strain JCM 16519 / RA8) TaxID=662548 RepID=UPI0013194237|nr:MSMEG_0565 family glycosyltransferase [Variovorax sp. RA8]VTU18836.1 GDP-mannose-dependent alpha-(1-2)-phosphatidylinositol mannosyltransferase [Variovorax sp. RA8]